MTDLVYATTFHSKSKPFNVLVAHVKMSRVIDMFALCRSSYYLIVPRPLLSPKKEQT
jgi:hypothetical protein